MTVSLTNAVGEKGSAIWATGLETDRNWVCGSDYDAIASLLLGNLEWDDKSKAWVPTDGRPANVEVDRLNHAVKVVRWLNGVPGIEQPAAWSE